MNSVERRQPEPLLNPPVDLVDNHPDSPTYGTVIYTDQATIDKINQMIASRWGLGAFDDGW